MKLTDARVATLQGFFDAGDQPTSAQFDQLILWVQQGIEEHDHAGTGDGDGVNNLVGPVGIGTGTPVRELHVGNGTDATFQAYVGITANVAGIGQVSARNSTNNVEIGMTAHITGGYLGMWTNHELRLRTNNVDRLIITAAGLIGIKVAVPTAQFEVTSDVGVTGSFTTTKANGNTNAVEAGAITNNTGDNRAIFASAQNAGAGKAYTFYGIGSRLYNDNDITIGRTAGGFLFLSAAGGDERAGIHSNVNNELLFKVGAAVLAVTIDLNSKVIIADLAGVGQRDVRVNADGTLVAV